MTLALGTGASQVGAAVATDTWTTGTSDGKWSTVGNWASGNKPPASGDSLVFGTTTGTTTLSDDLTAGISIANITFNSNAPSYTIGGNSITLTSGITDNSANLQTISDALVLGAARTFTTNAAGGSLLLSGVLSGAGSVVVAAGSGTLILNNTETYSGGTIINGGNLQVGDGAGGSIAGALTFNATGTFNYQGISTGSTLALGTLALSAGDATVQSTYGGSGNTLLSFSAMTRAAGATANFLASGGVNGTAASGGTNAIVVTGVTTDSFISQGAFYAGSNYAFYDAGGFVRALDYTKDAGAATFAGGTTLAGTFVQTTGDVTDQQTTTFTTLNLSGNDAFTLHGGATLTVNGILKTGGVAGGSTISGGAGIQAASNAEMVIRTDQSADLLTVSTPILANGTSGLTKSGAGTLVLSAANTYTGGTFVDGGLLQLVGSATLGATTSPLTVSGGTLDLNGTSQTVGALGGILGTILNNGSGQRTLTVGNGSSGTTTYAGVIASGTGGLAVTSVGTGTLVLSGISTYTGPTTISAGTLAVTTEGASAGAGGSLGAVPSTFTAGSIVLNGGTLQDNATVTFGANRGILIGPAGGKIVASGGNFEFQGVIADQTATPGALTVSSGGAVYIPNAQDTYSGGTTLATGSTTVPKTSSLGPDGSPTSGPFGTGTLIFAGGAIRNSTGSASALTIKNTLSIAASTTFPTGGVNMDRDLIFTGPTTLTAGGVTLTVSNSPAAGFQGIFLNGVIGDGGNNFGLAKNGTGTLILSAANMYGGATAVTQGALSVRNTSGSATGTGNVSLTAATLSSGSTGSIAGSLSMSGASILAPGGIGSIGTLGIGGGLTLNASGTPVLNLDLTSPTGPGDLLTIGGAFTANVNLTLAFNAAPSASGFYKLIQFPSQSAAATAIGNITLPAPPSIRVTYALDSSHDSGFVDLSVTSTSVDTVWTQTGGGIQSWTPSGNWSNGVPGLSGDTAEFTSTPIAAQTVQLNGQQHVGTLILNPGGSFGFTIAQATGSDQLVLDNGSQPAAINNQAGVNAISAPIVLLSNSTITNAGTLTVTGGITGTGNLTLNNNASTALTLSTASVNNSGTITNSGTGAGTTTIGAIGANVTGVTQNSASSALILSGNNTFTGGVSLLAGQLNLNGTSQSSGLTITSGTATLGNVTGLGPAGVATVSFVANTTGKLQINALSPNVAAITTDPVNPGSAIIENGGATSGTLTVTNSTADTFAGLLQNGAAGSLALTKAGAGTLTLTGQNSYTGLTTVTAGTLQLGRNGALNTADPVTLNASGAGVTATLDLQGFNQTAGVVSLAGTTTTSSDRIIGTGTLTLGGSGIAYSASANPAAATISVATLDLNNATPNINVAHSTSNAGPDLTISSTIQNGGFNKTSAGTLLLSGNNTFSGVLTINAGVVQLGNPGALVTASNLAFGASAALGTQLQLNGFNATVGGLATNAAPGSPVVENGSASTPATLTVLNGSSSTYAGALIDGGAASLSFTKVGTSQLTLTGLNTYSGATVFQGGTLLLNAGGKDSGTSGFAFTGATLSVDDTGTAVSNRLGSGAVTLQSSTFKLTGNTAGPTSVSESVGTFTVGLGTNTITLTQGTATGTSTLLTASSLAKNTGGFGFLRGSSLGTGTTSSNVALFRLTTLPSAAAGTLIGGGGTIGGTNTNVSIVPFLVGDASITGRGTTFIGYDTTNGSLRPLDPANEFVNFTGATADLTTVSATDNVRLATSTGVTFTGSTVNSILLDNTGTGGIVVPYTLNGTLTVTSGALLFAGSGANLHSQTLAAGTNAVLQFGTQEGVITNSDGFTATVAVPIQGSAGVTLNTITSGTLALSNTANSYSGPTTVNGAVNLPNSNVIPDASAVVVPLGGTLSLTSTATGQTETVGSLAGGGNVGLAATGGGTLIAGGDNTSTTFSGVMSGTGGNFTKQGAGAQTFSGANTYTGTTLVKGGTLLASNTTGSATGTGTVNVGDSSGANAFHGALAGTGSVAGPVNVFNGSTLSAGTGTTTGVPGQLKLNTASGSTALSAGASYNVKVNDAAGVAGASDGWDLLTMNTVTVPSTGSFTVNLVSLDPLTQSAGNASNFNAGQNYSWIVAQITQGSSASSLNASILANNLVLNTAGFANAPGSAGFSLQGVDAGAGVTNLDVIYTPSAAPEPTSLALLGVAAAGVLLRRRRRAAL